MDYSLHLSPYSVVRHKGSNKTLGKKRLKADDESSKVSVCGQLCKGTELKEIRSGDYDGLCQEENIGMSSDDVMMDKLFQACDPLGRGMVRVSSLVQYLTSIVDINLQEGGAVDILKATLDPKSIDIEIDSETFRDGLHNWIGQMKSGQFVDMNLLMSNEDSIVADSIQTEGMESSLEESTVEERLSISQLSSKLTDFQHLNHKLSEEVHESQCIIDSKEEELLKQARDLDNARSQIKRLQELADFRHEAEAENELLRERMTALSESLDAERHKTKKSEQEKELLKTQLQRFQTQMMKISTEQSISQQEQEDLKSLLIENKEKIFQLKAVCSGLDAQLAQKEEHVQELQSCLRDVNRMNDDLKIQNQELQGELSEAKQELMSLKCELDKTRGSARFLSVQEMASEIEEDLEQSESWPGSIHNELQDLLSDGPHLSWPLSKKELQETAVPTPDLVSQVGHAVHHQSTEEETFSSGMSDLQLVDSTNPGDSPRVRNKCTCDFHYDVSNDKLRFIVTLLKHFKDENQELKLLLGHGGQSSSDCVQFDTKKQPLSDKAQSDILKKKLDSGKEFLACKQDPSEPDSTNTKLHSQIQNLLLDAANLKRSNAELAEKLQKAEYHVNTLEEEIHSVRSCLNKEKQYCAELEESLCSSTLARQLDLRDIWRLVQKDIENECQDLQEDSLNGSSSDEIKEKIKVEIEALRTKHDKRETTLKQKNLNFPLVQNYQDLHERYIWDNAHKLKSSSGSYLVDALAIDVFNGNLPMYHSNYPYPPTAVSCEDVDCYECRAARCIIQTRYSTSCPSVASTNVNNCLHQILKLNNDYPDSQAYPKAEYSEPRTVDTTSDADICVQNTPKRKRSLYGSCRRQDFIRSSGRVTKEKCQQFLSQSQLPESTTKSQSNDQITGVDSYMSVSDTDIPNCSSHSIPTDSSLPATEIHEPIIRTRRSSFTLAVESSQEKLEFSSENSQSVYTDTSSQPSSEDLRRPSFHAAIELGKDATPSPMKRKVVQIASPEISESREIIDRDSTHGGNGDGVVTCDLDLTTTIYQPDKSDTSSYGGIPAGAQNREQTVQEINVKPAATDAHSTSSSYSLLQTSAWTSSRVVYDLHHCTESRHTEHTEQVHAHAALSKIRDGNAVTQTIASRPAAADMSQPSHNKKETAKGPSGAVATSLAYPLRTTETQNLKQPKSGKSASSSKQCAGVTPPPPSLSSMPVQLQPQQHSLGVPTGQTAAIANTNEKVRANAQVGNDSTLAGTQQTGDTNLSRVQTSSTESELTDRKREHMKARSMKLPELSETSTQPPTNRLMNVAQRHASLAMPQISVTDEDAEVPPAPSDDMITPSLPDSFLKKLGLSVSICSSGDNGNSVKVDQLQDKEIESKFLSLSLAFKTDRLTLDQRASIQERARDLAEQNVDIELQALRKAVEAINELTSDVQVRSMLQKIRLHINVLEQISARVSSRAEVYGAVQQERRLCKAVDVMVLHTENLRRIREKEESELHEARKLLSEKSRNGLNVDADSSPGRRAMSVCGYSSMGRPMRRRSDVALPKIIGGVGSPSLIPSAAMDPKQRFQSAVASTSMQNVVTTTMRHCSLEKQLSLSPPSFFVSSAPITLSANMDLSTNSMSESRGEKADTRVSQDEEAFRKGFEEGLKTKLSHDLNELRDQQNSISHSLEEVMDKVDLAQIEDEAYYSKPSCMDLTVDLVTRMGGYILHYDWRSNKKVIRNLAGVFFVILAIFIVFFSPPISTIDVRHVAKPPQ